MQLVISDEDVEALGRRTEGWITGLKLAALSMLEESDRHAFVTAFSGNDRYIADYLVDEVLQRQSEEVQCFLLQPPSLSTCVRPCARRSLACSDAENCLITWMKPTCLSCLSTTAGNGFVIISCLQIFCNIG